MAVDDSGYVAIRRAWTPDESGTPDGYGCRMDMGTGRSGAAVEMRTPGKHGRWAKRWLALGSPLDKPLSGWLVRRYKFRLLRGLPKPPL